MRNCNLTFYVISGDEIIYETFSLIYAISFLRELMIDCDKIKCSDGREWTDVDNLTNYYKLISEEIDYLMSF